MSAVGKYFVKGKFEGYFTTDQKNALTAGGNIPEGEEHLVQIYRGLITESTEIKPTDFEASQRQYHFKRINNIQINTSPNWPIKNDRIYSLNDLKLSNVRITNVEMGSDKTTAIIHGDVMASVADKPFDSNQETDPYNPGKGAKPFNPDDPNNDQNGENPTKGAGPNPRFNFPNHPGCNRLQQQGCNPKWLRWLWMLLLLLLLLYLLAKCSQAGRNIYCKIDNWRIEQKINKVKGEIDTLEQRINQTEPEAAPCGGQINHEGKNQYWDQRFNIGTQDGMINIGFNAKTMPDRLEVIYDGKLVAETNSNTIEGYPELNGKGFQQDSTILRFNYKYSKNKPTELLLRVIPNKNEPRTVWFIDLSCPQ